MAGRQGRREINHRIAIAISCLCSSQRGWGWPAGQWPHCSCSHRLPSSPTVSHCLPFPSSQRAGSALVQIKKTVHH